MDVFVDLTLKTISAGLETIHGQVDGGGVATGWVLGLAVLIAWLMCWRLQGWGSGGFAVLF